MSASDADCQQYAVSSPPHHIASVHHGVHVRVSASAQHQQQQQYLEQQALEMQRRQALAAAAGQAVASGSQNAVVAQAVLQPQQPQVEQLSKAELAQQ